jgi:uncharacterized protein (TIGR02266 family)
MQNFGGESVENGRSLPADAGEGRRPEAAGARQGAGSWRKILLGDDIALFLELEQTFFRRDGVELLVARNGRQALEMAGAVRPDLVLLGLELPEPAGDECCRRLKQDPELRSIPVILVAPDDQADSLERCRQAGCDAVLTKPIDTGLFLQSASRFLSVASRIAPRASARLRIHFGVGTQRLLVDYSVNLSTGGVFIESREVLPVETPLTIEFSLPEAQRTIRCRGRVAWINEAERPVCPSLPPGMGVQFLDLSLDDLHALREFIDRKSLHPSW